VHTTTPLYKQQQSWFGAALLPLEPGVRVPHYSVEVLAGWALFGIVGIEAVLGGNCSSASSYFSRYVDETSALDEDSLDSLNTAYFVCMFTSRLLGAIYQHVSSTAAVVRATVALLGVASLAALAMLLFPAYGTVLWVGVCIVGLCYGTIPPFVLVLLHRMTSPTAASTAIVMMFVNAGVLYVLWLWEKTFFGDGSTGRFMF